MTPEELEQAAELLEIGVKEDAFSHPLMALRLANELRVEAEKQRKAARA